MLNALVFVFSLGTVVENTVVENTLVWTVENYLQQEFDMGLLLTVLLLNLTRNYCGKCGSEYIINYSTGIGMAAWAASQAWLKGLWCKGPGPNSKGSSFFI